jgi:hypothetical protein
MRTVRKPHIYRRDWKWYCVGQDGYAVSYRSAAEAYRLYAYGR